MFIMINNKLDHITFDTIVFFFIKMIENYKVLVFTCYDNIKLTKY